MWKDAVLSSAGLALLECLYILLAKKLHIGTARPEKRFVPVGGGIIIVIASLLALFFDFVQVLYPLIFTGVALGIVSFIDDLRGLSPLLRLCLQLLASGFVLSPLLADGHYDIYFIALLGCTGYINSSNFMDGINGMLTSYSLVTLGTLYAIVRYRLLGVPGDYGEFTEAFEGLWVFLIAALLVFSFFNFRTKALVYAGDTGSITTGYFAALSICFVGMAYSTPSVVVITGVFLTDTFCTFLYRLFNGEAVMQPHKKHLYQQLVSRGASPLAVSAAYAGIQAAINAGWLCTPATFRNIYAIVVAIALVTSYRILHR